MQKILIIDDEIDILGMLERYFRLNGHAVITAESAAEAQGKPKDSFLRQTISVLL